MNKDQMRVAIATHLFPQFPVFWDNGALRHQYPDGKSGPVFNYPEDLNAMHEAEKIFDDNIKDASSLRYEYASNLYSVVAEECQPCRATAEQRAEAFLRTVNKWIE